MDLGPMRLFPFETHRSVLFWHRLKLRLVVYWLHAVLVARTLTPAGGTSSCQREGLMSVMTHQHADILVVDDDPGMLETLEDVLAKGAIGFTPRAWATRRSIGWPSHPRWTWPSSTSSFRTSRASSC